MLNDDARYTVNGIFERAERCFEARVVQLLEQKRVKAQLAGQLFNSRKAKRDARTAAGREKLESLVRRLADLALVQERAIATVDACEHHADIKADVHLALDGISGLYLGIAAMAHAASPPEPHTPPRAPLDDAPAAPADDKCMFAATKSVVNFVLESEAKDDASTYSPRAVRDYGYFGEDLGRRCAKANFAPLPIDGSRLEENSFMLGQSYAPRLNQ